MEKKTQPCQEAQLLFPLSRRLLANNNSRFFLKSCKRNKMQLNQQIDHCPVLTNLKHLTLFCFTNHDQSLLGWTSLINASPVLQKLTLKLIISSFCRSYSRREIQKCDGHPLKCLKTLEIVGLEGYCVDLELAMYVLENAIMLEEVVIDTRSPFSEKDSKPDLMAQKRAMKLSSKLPQGAKLIFK